jgi:hypothetical protein
MKYAVATNTKLAVKGQMKYVKELNLILFLGHPM